MKDPQKRKAYFDEMVARMYEHGKALNTATHFEGSAVFYDNLSWIQEVPTGVAPVAKQMSAHIARTIRDRLASSRRCGAWATFWRAPPTDMGRLFARIYLHFLGVLLVAHVALLFVRPRGATPAPVGDAVDVGGDDVGLDFVGGDLCGGRAVMDRIDRAAACDPL